MPELRDSTPALRRAMRQRPLPSSVDRSARRDVALVTGWLRSLTSVDGRTQVVDRRESPQPSGLAQP